MLSLLNKADSIQRSPRTFRPAPLLCALCARCAAHAAFEVPWRHRTRKWVRTTFPLELRTRALNFQKNAYKLVNHNAQHTNERPLNQPSIEIIEWHITQMAMKRLKKLVNQHPIQQGLRSRAPQDQLRMIQRAATVDAEDGSQSAH